MASKVTCTTCKKVWPTRVDYMMDKKKCGSEHCPCLSNGSAPTTTDNGTVPKEKTPTCVYGIHAVHKGADSTVGDRLYVTVPKVLTMKVSME